MWAVSPGHRRRPAVLSHQKRRCVLLAQSWWEDRVLRGVADYASTHNWELQCRMHWTHQLPLPGEWRGDGIIAFAGVSRQMQPATRRLIAFVRGAKVPVVETQAFGNHFNAPKVVVPHEAIGRLAADYLLGLNFRHLGYVAFDENLLEQHRRLGFQRAVEAAGATFHALTPRSLKRTIARLPKPMALLAVNDPNALEVIMACHDAGYRVPEEFAVMGIDDTEIVCDLGAVSLTSINCNYERQGYEAAALLDRLMNGGRKPAAPIIVPPRGVTVRRSTDIVAIPDLDTARVLRFMRDHYLECRSIQEIVRELGVPLRRVHSHFREHVGCTLLQELTRLRVEHAKQLLRESKAKMEAVAQESGFSNRFHFVQAFRRVTGQTPRTWRRSIPNADPREPSRALVLGRP
jgi:LacI family transcriptional regulator